MDATPFIGQLAATRQFLVTATADFRAEDAAFTPRPGLLTVAGHLAHVALTVDWFIAGAFLRPEGFDLDFPEHLRQAQAVTSLAVARAEVDRAFAAAQAAVASHALRLYEPLPAGPIMGGAPRLAIIGGIVDHTAHHRGALAVYARLLGREPALPYG